MTDKQYIKYINQTGLYDFTDKTNYILEHILYQLNRFCNVMKIGNIQNVPGLKYHERELKLWLLCRGYIALNVKPINGEFFAFYGGLGGEQDPYYQPTIFTCSNRALNISEEWKIHDDCVVVRNDSNYMGIMPLLNRYASLLCETELSMYNAVIDTRSQMAGVAANDKIKDALEKYYDDRLKGKITAILGNGFFDDKGNGISPLELKSSSSEKPLESLVEFCQYLKASEYNDLGLNANYNMKRESLNSAESALNDDILFPLPDDMKKNWQLGFDEWNEKTGYNLQAEFDSSWADNKKEEKAQIESIDTKNDKAEDEIKQPDEQKKEQEEKKDEQE